MATQENRPMVSEVAIANQALGWLGQGPIVSFDENSTKAQLMRDNYPFLRDAVLTEVAWTFAVVRNTSTTADEAEWGRRFKHPVPLGWLQVLRVFRDVSSERLVTSSGWSREGNYILAREDTIYMRGIERVVDTARFSQAFVQCLATRLAADLCMVITENIQQQGYLWQLYGAKVKEAAISDGVQGSNEMISSDKWINARNKGFATSGVL